MSTQVLRGWAHFRILGFESLIGALMIVSGIAGLLRVGLSDPIDLYLPDWLSTTLQSLYLLGGVLLVWGLWTGRRRSLESGGLYVLIAISVVRWFMYGYALSFGSDFLVVGVFTSAVVVAAVWRLQLIRRNEAVVVIPLDTTPVIIRIDGDA